MMKKRATKTEKSPLVCAICGRPAVKHVIIKNLKYWFKYADCLRCAKHVKCAVRAYKEDNVELKSVSGPPPPKK
jgi:predicted amidophosphoribosyltransferase